MFTTTAEERRWRMATIVDQVRHEDEPIALIELLERLGQESPNDEDLSERATEALAAIRAAFQPASAPMFEPGQMVLVMKAGWKVTGPVEERYLATQGPGYEYLVCEEMFMENELQSVADAASAN